MTAEFLNVSTHCSRCGAELDIDEIHFYDNGDGTATCDACEVKWANDVTAWLRGERDNHPDDGDKETVQ